ncbi:MAG: hypothetical protein O2U61_07255 [Candidatus Bathyarchaeota archaeon]|nr:hypothetical protein [Candidatus Bathyarchaeota archaeon]
MQEKLKEVKEGQINTGGVEKKPAYHNDRSNYAIRSLKLIGINVLTTILLCIFAYDSWLIMFLPLFLLLCSLILGIMGLKSIKRGIAITGIILSIIGLLGGSIFWFVIYYLVHSSP